MRLHAQTRTVSALLTMPAPPGSLTPLDFAPVTHAASPARRTAFARAQVRAFEDPDCLGWPLMASNDL